MCVVCVLCECVVGLHVCARVCGPHRVRLASGATGRKTALAECSECVHRSHCSPDGCVYVVVVVVVMEVVVAVGSRYRYGGVGVWYRRPASPRRTTRRRSCSLGPAGGASSLCAWVHVFLIYVWLWSWSGRAMVRVCDHVGV